MSDLHADQVFNSQQVDSTIDDIVAEIGRANAALEGPRPARENLISSAQEMMKQTGENRGRPLYYPYIGSGLGRGALVELVDGSVKLDLINGIGIHILGHSHPRLLKASLKAAMSDITIQGNLQPNREYSRFGAKLVELARKNSRLQHAWITTSGSMANEIALKISRQKNHPARMILAMEHAFAGRTTMMTEIGDNPAHSVGQPEYGEVLRVPFFDAKDPQSAEKSLRVLKEHVAKHGKNISIFGFEPVQGEGGFCVAPREYFVPLLEFCREQGIAVWADEVQTFCRTGEFFAYEKLGLGEYIDICSLAKTAQAAATLYTAEYNPQPGLIAGTFSGSSVALAAGCEVLETLQDEGYVGAGGRIEKIHEKFMHVLNGLIEGSCREVLSDAGGIGLMVAVTPFGGEKEKVFGLLKTLYQNGLMAFACGHGPYRLRFLVPASITDAEIDGAGEILEKSLLHA